MSRTFKAAQQPQITLTEAKKVLGTTAMGMSDDAIMRLVAQVEVLTDIVIVHVQDSKIQSAIDISNSSPHTGL